MLCELPPNWFVGQLTLRVPIRAAADNIFKKKVPNKTTDIPICQGLFSLKNKKKKIECHLLQLLLGDLRINVRNSPDGHFAPAVHFPHLGHCDLGPVVQNLKKLLKSYLEIWQYIDSFC